MYREKHENIRTRVFATSQFYVCSGMVFAISLDTSEALTLKCIVTIAVHCRLSLFITYVFQLKELTERYILSQFLSFLKTNSFVCVWRRCSCEEIFDIIYFIYYVFRVEKFEEKFYLGS